jgi:hypothetical protein
MPIGMPDHPLLPPQHHAWPKELQRKEIPDQMFLQVQLDSIFHPWWINLYWYLEVLKCINQGWPKVHNFRTFAGTSIPLSFIILCYLSSNNDNDSNLLFFEMMDILCQCSTALNSYCY